MYSIWYSAHFKKDMKKVIKRGYDLNKMEPIIALLSAGQPLPARYRDHALGGNWEGCRECHITPDWLLVYLSDSEKLVLTLTRTGTHSDLF